MSDADVGFYTYDYAAERAFGGSGLALGFVCEGGHGSLHLWRQHGEKGFVAVDGCDNAVWCVEIQFGACGAEFGGLLGCCEDRDVEDLCCKPSAGTWAM